MIETFKYIEVWETEQLAQIPSHLNLPMIDIVRWYNDKHKIKSNVQNDCANMRSIQNKPNSKPRIETIIKLTQMFEDYYISNNLTPLDGRIRVIDPTICVKELKDRDIIAKEFQNEYPQYKISLAIQIWTGKTYPKLDMLKDITEYIIKCDEEALDLPKAVGRKWDLDNWIKTSKIKRKQSWEQQYD